MPLPGRLLVARRCRLGVVKGAGGFLPSHLVGGRLDGLGWDRQAIHQHFQIPQS